jgi:hypothetical protein
MSASEKWITLWNLDFFYSPRRKVPKKIKRTMFFWYKQFWTKPWKKMDWSTSFFCNLSSKQQITPNLILGKEVYKALNCVPTYVRNATKWPRNTFWKHVWQFSYITFYIISWLIMQKYCQIVIKFIYSDKTAIFFTKSPSWFEFYLINVKSKGRPHYIFVAFFECTYEL